MASVLRAVLPVGALSADASIRSITGPPAVPPPTIAAPPSADASIRSITGPVGSPEIQEAARPFAQGDTLGRAYLETRSEVVGALADGSAAWFHGGSRMS